MNFILTCSELLEEYFICKKSENLSNETLKTYDIHITRFLQQMDLQNATADTFCDKRYKGFILYLQSTKIKDVTITCYCRSIKSSYG